MDVLDVKSNFQSKNRDFVLKIIVTEKKLLPLEEADLLDIWHGRSPFPAEVRQTKPYPKKK